MDSCAVARTDHARSRVDHLVPVLLGGSNNVANLRPQPEAAGEEAADKDALELRLRQLGCPGAVPLANTQAAVAATWSAAYHQ